MGKAAKQEQFSEDDLEGLGPEELAALEAEKEDDEELDDEDDPDDDDKDDDQEEEDEEEEDLDDEPDPEPEPDKDKAKGKDKEKPAPKDGAADEDVDDAEPDLDLGVKSAKYSIDEQAVAAAKKVLDDIDGEFEALGEKFDKGDIDEKTFATESRALQRKERDASRVVDRAEIYKDLNVSNETNDLKGAQERFFRKPENKFFDDELTFPALQAALNIVSQDPKFSGASYDAMLAEAGKRAMKKFGHPAADDKADKTPGKKSAKDKLNDRREAKDKVQGVIDKTLSDKTGAGKDDGKYAGKFDHLESLEGMELEQALASMSEDDQRRWAEG
ncbi:MAG: hypothetical protein Q8N34_03240 [Gammaproteobacteria bacterium]|nr:hypothetical protein [Gammaproteobacteria bacterium]